LVRVATIYVIFYLASFREEEVSKVVVTNWTEGVIKFETDPVKVNRLISFNYNSICLIPFFKENVTLSIFKVINATI
jgi:hypothetical protein